MNHQAAIDLDIASYRRPVTVSFQDLTYSIRSGPGNSADKEILKKISGKFESGQFTAILGPSGAGKTTLLNVLSGFKSSGVTGGSVLFNDDSPMDEATRRKCSYITQDSEMLQNLTVLETMNTAVHLKLGRKLYPNVRLKIISDVLHILSLTKCVDTRVKKLSGGELKRLSIAVEMITNPPVMFFDEPTSGLDSSASLQVMTHLRELAKSGRTVVCSIHQPSSRLLELIDAVYLLSSGQCLYRGPLQRMVEHFEQANYHCPPQYNRADFALEVASNERYGDYEKLLESDSGGGGGEGEEDKANREKEKSDVYELQPMIVTIGNGGAGGSPSQMDKGKISSSCKAYRVNFWDQTVVLINRSMRDSFRSLLYCQLRIVATALVALLLGSIFWQIGLHADHMATNASCIYFFLLFILFSNAMSTVITFPYERKVFMREHLNNWYSVGAYVLAKIISGLPLQLICPTIFICIAYFMTGQPHEWQRFLLLWLILILIAVMADSLGMLVGAAFDMQLGTFVVCAIFIPNLLVSGFFIKYSELPVAYRPWYGISFLRFGFEGSLNAVYGFGRPDLICEGATCLITKPEKFMKILELDLNSFWMDAIGLCVWTGVLWVLLYVTVRIRLRRSQ